MSNPKLACGTVPEVGMRVQRLQTVTVSRKCRCEPWCGMFYDDAGNILWAADFRAVPQEQPMSDQYAEKLREMQERWEDGGWMLSCLPGNPHPLDKNTTDQQAPSGLWYWRCDPPQPATAEKVVPRTDTNALKSSALPHKPLSKGESQYAQPFVSGTGMLGATAPGQRVTAENAHHLPPGSVVVAPPAEPIKDTFVEYWENRAVEGVSQISVHGVRQMCKEIRRLQQFESLYSDLKKSYAELESRLTYDPSRMELWSKLGVAEQLWQQEKARSEALRQRVAELEQENLSLKNQIGTTEESWTVDSDEKDAELAELRAKLAERNSRTILKFESTRREMRGKIDDLEKKLAEREHSLRFIYNESAVARNSVQLIRDLIPNELRSREGG